MAIVDISEYLRNSQDGEAHRTYLYLDVGGNCMRLIGFLSPLLLLFDDLDATTRARCCKYKFYSLFEYSHFDM